MLLGAETRASAREPGQSSGDERNPQSTIEREVLAVWAIFAVDAAAVFATYSRIPARELYHVSGSGPTAGLGRALVFLNFPTALVALPILALLAVRGGRAVRALAAAAAVLCAAVFWPGVVDQADLDAKPANAIAATGVALAVALTVHAVRRGGVPRAVRARGDRARVALVIVLVLVSLPWIWSDLGFLIGKIAPFRWVYESTQWWAPFGSARLHRAVHVGHHHGEDGLLVAVSALLLSRTLPRVRGRFRPVLSLYLALLLLYGLANILNDGWYEQIVKRGWTDWTVPSMLLPAPNLAWAALVVCAVLVSVLLFRRLEGETASRGWLTSTATVAAGAVLALVVVGATEHGDRYVYGHATPPGDAPGTIAVTIASGRNPDLYLLRGDTETRVTRNDHADVRPAWSPDGAQIAFQSNRDGGNAVYVTRANGLGLRRIAEGGEPTWHPSGEEVSFVAHGRIVDLGVRGEWPAWSRDERFAWDDGRDVYVGRRRVAVGRYPAWSPHGRLAYEHLDGGSWHIYVLGRGALTQGPQNDFAPSWSPDGRRIVFVSDRDGPDQLYVVDADGSNVRRLTAGQADRDTPAWRP